MSDPNVIGWSNESDSGQWLASGTGMAESPFNMEAILRACPELLKVWKLKPFVFDVTSDGRVVVRYVAAGEPSTCGMRCQLAGELCGAMSEPVGGFICTLPKNHAGPHIACGGDSYRHDIETWA